MISHDTKTIQSWLRSSISSRLRVPGSQIDASARFSEYGLDPACAVAVLSELSEALGRDLAPALLWDYQTIESLADHLAGAPTAWTIDPHAASEAEPSTGFEPIAITGLGCRFPGAPNPPAFWDLLRQGQSAVGEIPPARWNVEAFYDADAAKPGKMNTRWGGFLDQIDGFDALFFGISPREAVQIDPQQRLLLEVVWESLEDAGLPPASLQGSDTGVFLGAMWCDYAQLLCAALPHITQHTATGQNLSLIANRISYTFGFHGPSLTVNTSSSSSLVAVHLACQSLRTGECRLAIAGGVNLIITPQGTIAMSKLGTMSPDGRSRAFDARANGYVRGEGAGVVVLKPLSDALAAGDPIYCVIRGSAVNNDGFSKGLAVPNPQAQEALLQEAYRRAGVAPRTVHYVEAHAAGTMIGDPIESEALGAVLGLDRTAENPLVVGSVKTNIGHLESAAGIAGLIKLALSIKHRTIPPSLHFEQPPPQLDLAGRHLQVQQTCAPWPHEEARALAGVSSFGFGGTNCHVVLEEFRAHDAPALSPPAAGSPSVVPLVAITPEVKDLSGDEKSLVPRLFLLSAHTSEALAELAQATQSWLSEETTATFHNLCYTASVRRSHLAHRLALLASSTGELRDHLQSFLSGQPSPSIACARATAPARPVWLFPGLGGHFHGLGRELYAQEPVFRRALELCDSLVQQHTGWSVIEQVLADEAQARLHETEVVLPVLFSVEVSMAQMLRNWGLEGAAVIGYSLGEVAAAHVAGVLELEEAVRVVCERARLMGRLDGQGQMLAVEMSEADAARLASICGVSIGAVNSLRSVVLSGGRAAMEEVVRRVEAEGVKWQDVGVESAYHSEEMRVLGAELRKRLGMVRAERATPVVYSTVCGERIRGDEMGVDYWVRHMVERVEFGSAVRRAAADGYEMYVEVGGQPVLKGAVRAGIAEWQAEASQEGGSAGEGTGASEEALVVSTMRRGRGEREEVLRGVSELWVRGCEVQWGRMYDGGGEVVRLPCYPWQRERFWIESGAAKGALTSQPLPTASGPEKVSELGPSLPPHGNGVAHVSKNGNGRGAGDHRNGNGKLMDQKQLVREMCEHPPRLLNYLREQAARVLQLESSRLDPGTPLIRLGIESLMSLELKLRIEHELGLKLAAGRHLQDLSVAELATQLSNQLTLRALVKPDGQELSQASVGGDEWETWRI